MSTVGPRGAQGRRDHALAVAVLTIVIMSAVVAPPRGGVAIRSIVPVPPAVGSRGDLRGSELVRAAGDVRLVFPPGP